MRHGQKVKARLTMVGLFVALCAMGTALWLSHKPLSWAPTPARLTLAEGSRPIAGPVYVAHAQGYFEAEGLEVILQPHTSGKAALQAVLEGRADLGTVAETPIMHAAMKGEQIYVVATIHQSEQNTVVVARQDRGILSPIDLSGRGLVLLSERTLSSF